MEPDEDILGQEFVCRHCGSTLIQPIEWTPLGSERWCLLVRCPECFRFEDLVLTEDQSDEFLAAMDVAEDNLKEAAELLNREIFRDECDSFVRALRADLLGPLDFERHHPTFPHT
jgi:hypothetical protein